MKETKTEFGKELRTLRENRRMTQQKFADRWGVNRAQVSVFETTYELPSLNLVERLSEAFQVEALDWLQRDRKIRRAKSLVKEEKAVNLPCGVSLSFTVALKEPKPLQGEKYESAS